MIVRRKVLLALVAAALLVGSSAHAATLTSNVPLAGTFTAGVSGSGTATLNGASGTFRQWLLFTHANINVSAGAQNVGLSVANVGTTNYSASGNSSLTYDNWTPTAPLQVNSFDADLNGNSNINADINVNPFTINTSLGNFQLKLTFDGQITDLDFQSTGPSTTAGAFYNVPGNFVATLSGAVTGQLVNVPIIGTINLGTLYNLTPTQLVIPGNLPGTVATADASGGAGPWAATLLAQYQAALANIVAPISLPFAVSINQSVPNGSSGFSKLDASGTLNANLTFNNVSYNLNGSVANVVVPEPGTFALAFSALAGVVVLGMLRRR